jgi:hypothetical protein
MERAAAELFNAAETVPGVRPSLSAIVFSVTRSEGLRLLGVIPISLLQRPAGAPQAYLVAHTKSKMSARTFICRFALKVSLNRFNRKTSKTVNVNVNPDGPNFKLQILFFSHCKTEFHRLRLSTPGSDCKSLRIKG